MYKMLITVLAARTCRVGKRAAAELFSVTGPVIAIMANDPFLGEAEGHLSGGTIAIHSQRNPLLARQFTSAELGGSGQCEMQRRRHWNLSLCV
jgi:hypothetical protein